MKRVLMTGTTGFIGAHAVAPLLARGYEVHTIGPHAPADLGIFWHQADLLIPGAADRVVADIQASHLLHLAWYAAPGLFWASPRNLDWTAASLRLVQSFHQAGGVRAVVAGTCVEAASAQSPPSPSETLYGVSKDGLRRILTRYAATTGLSFGWARVFYLYGPGEKPGRLVSGAICRLLAGERFAVTSGHQCLDYSHVADVAGGMVALLDSPAEGSVDLGSGRAVAVRDLLTSIGTHIGCPDLIDYGAEAMPLGEVAVIEANTARLHQELRFRPRYDLHTGIAETVRWWQAQRRLPPGA